MRNTELYLKEVSVIYGFHLLSARLPKLAPKLERLDCSHLFYSEHRSKLSTDYSSCEWWYEIVRKMTLAIGNKQVSITTLHVSVWAFLQN